MTASNDAPSASVRLFIPVYTITFISAIDQSLAAPSMWHYIRALGGDAAMYSYALSAFLIARVICLPLVGLWVDRRPHIEVLRILVSIGLFASALYALAPLCESPWAIVVSRAVLGASSASSVATSSFIIGRTTPAERSRYMGFNNVLNNGMKLTGPGLNVFLVFIPALDAFGVHELLSLYTYVGWALLLCHLVALVLIGTAPSLQVRDAADTATASASATSAAAAAPVTLAGVVRHLAHTRAWVSYVLSANNNFGMQVVTWALPIITDMDFGWQTVQNSFFYAGMSLFGICSGVTSSLISGKALDRTIIVGHQVVIGLSFVCIALVTGCAGGARPSPALLFAAFALYAWASQGQIPGNIGLYSKLVGRRNAGLYQSILQTIMAIARVGASSLIGAANLEAGGMWNVADCSGLLVHDMASIAL
eukprot:TRINITY_DN12255_c0_g1_i2.p1 TRINITY_DN12255_c0_g1~~TRINITY_DN12255_c0_g1_i2.p1  ORF type:complete len:423 (-),score=39.47 TRINITY_DN12255_c0_g1_i2:646-1914(-)